MVRGKYSSLEKRSKSRFSVVYGVGKKINHHAPPVEPATVMSRIDVRGIKVMFSIS